MPAPWSSATISTPVSLLRSNNRMIIHAVLRMLYKVSRQFGGDQSHIGRFQVAKIHFAHETSRAPPSFRDIARLANFERLLFAPC